MEPYYQSWQASAHQDVTCTDCHYLPGIEHKIKGKFTALAMVANYMTGLYKRNKPWAEIEDASCLRTGCHLVESLGKEVLFKGRIRFNHESHINKLCRGKKLRCTSCHSQIVQGEHISVTEATCFLCHFKPSSQSPLVNECKLCHALPLKEDETFEVKYDHTAVAQNNIRCEKCHGSMRVGDGVVPKERCSVCHESVTMIERFNEINFIHKKHVSDHKVECQYCHLVIQHKSIARTLDIKPECSSCHESQHIEQFSLFVGKRIHDTSIPLPNPMFEAGLNCKACHIFHKYEGGVAGLSQATIAKGESCEKCHGKGYGKLFRRWEAIMQEKVETIGSQLEVVRGLVSASVTSPDSIDRINKILENALLNYQLVKRGNIVHNVAFCDQLLAEAADYLNQVLIDIKHGEKLLDMSVYSEMVPSQCKNCHYGQETVTVEAFGIQFQHSIHIVEQKLPCSKCHSDYQQHGETIISKEECLQCHHSQDVVSCEDCHRLQAQVYNGKIAFLPDAQPDVMAAEDIECRACHGGDEIIRKAGGSDCTECHDKSYAELLKESQQKTESALADLTRLLSSEIPDSSYQKNKEQLELIRAGISQIKADRSQGMHNLELVTETLNSGREILEEILK
jgi:hypothetical protein